MLLFFKNVHIGSNGGIGFLYSEYKGNQTRGAKPKIKKTIKPADGSAPNEKKCFDNQVTVIYGISEGYNPNVKIFRNGNVQMTGIRKPEDGEHIINVMVTELRRIHDNCCPEVVGDVNNLCPGDFKIRMINSNFSVPYSVRRKDLHKLLISSEYNNNCNFQGTTYPGVKLYFYWNSKNQYQDGVCKCSTPCFGKGTGHGEGECKKVTVAVFESGNVLITGANSYQQIDDAYAFITSVLVKHVQLLRKVLPSLTATASLLTAA
jgi:TATA-box binding protein (TBP) (component of TFIID and TFIIIB)